MERGERRNQCPTCLEFFVSTPAFDKHKTGTYTPNTRRCLNEQEMVLKGMVKNDKGYWITKENPMWK